MAERLKSVCLSAKLTNALLIVFILLMTSPPHGGAYQCNRTSVAEWHTEAAVINIDWSLDNVCSSYEECYGRTDPAEPDVHQLCPIEIQTNDRLVILPPTVSTRSALPVNVSYDDFLSCPSDAHPTSQWLVSSESQAPIEVSPEFLPESTSYFAQFPTGDAFLTCDLGLRVRVSVKSHDCERNQSEPFCSGGGQCVTEPFVSSLYICQCDGGYIGQYCEEIDGCYGDDPCANGGTCSDVIQGHSGREFECECPAEFIGQNCSDVVGACGDAVCGNGTCLQLTTNSFRCQCEAGYEGTYCEREIRECESNPCLNNGTCVDEVGAFSCACPADYVGIRCEEERDYCLSQPCENGASCSSFLGGYTCACIAGFTGQNCSENIDECEQRPCRNGATCVDGINSFRCVCQPGFTGPLCETEVDECSSQPCQNGATCQDLRAAFSCLCAPGYTGQTCSLEVDECGSAPCRNGGECVDLVDGYECLCPENLFGGIDCEIPLNNCSFYPCQNNGTCQVIDDTTYMCLCTDRYTGQNCDTFIPYCETHNCSSNATCQEEAGGFTCLCPIGYSGKWCEVDIDYCTNHNCSNNSTCLDETTSYRCLCEAGFEGRYCEINTDECGSDPCQNGGTCLDGINGYNCVCAAGFSREDCSLNVDECESSPCNNGGVCRDGVNGYICDCGIGFNGTQCDEDLDLCNLGVCRNSALNCSETQGGSNFTCLCAPGYIGQSCEIDVNECASEPCLNDAVCVDRVNSYQCYCLPGYVGDHCQFEIDECFSEPCQHNGTCVDLFNNYTCRCVPGYEGYNCEIDIDECEQEACRNGATCVDRVADYTCLCAAGYEGKNCSEDINECLSGPCQTNTTFECIDLLDNFTCRCRSGFEGRLCEVDVDECTAHDCRNGATCVDGIDEYSCVCQPGFTGNLCEIDIDECSSSPCNVGTCVDRIDGFVCECPDDSSPYDVFCNPLPPCTSDPCQNNGTCQQDLASYTFTCVCLPGFEGVTCEININDCALHGVTCANGGTCVDLLEDFRCECPPGFEGRFCENNVDDCIGNLCQFGSQCEDGIDSYVCLCLPGYTGQYCNVTIVSCEQDPCLNMGTCQDVAATTPPTASGPIQNSNPDNRRFRCQCAEGWEGVFCEVETDECASNPCTNDATCIDDFAGYTCRCHPGFTGVWCERDIDECLNHQCANGSTCVDGIAGYTCRCQPGFEGRLCEQEIDECDSSPCNEATSLCVDEVAGYRCFCLNGWAGPQCDINVDECLSQPCLNGATCVDGIADVSCLCLSGYTGKYCEIDIDECDSEPCQNGGECLDEVDGFTCLCAPGFTGSVCEVDIDECASNPCLRGGTCLDDVNAYQCLCPVPYRGDDCSLLPCEALPCENNANCTNFVDDLMTYPRGFYCDCLTGFMGERCEVNINDCSPDSCSRNGFCIDGIVSYSCLCEPGWAGFDCGLPIDDCVDNMCQNNSTCEDLNQAYRCHCVEGYEGDLCEVETDECASEPCENGATCVDRFNGFQCVCASGWTGELCEVDVNECDSDPCQNGATCLNGLDQFRCDCPPFFTGIQCDISFDPCDAGYNQCRNNATCITQPDGTYQCLCTAGFEGFNCDINTDECASVPCLNDAACIDGIDGYQCVCLPGFRGDRCEENIEDCIPGVCANGGTCVDGINGYTCECTAGWNGVNCTDDIDECQSAPCLNGATCLDRLNNFLCMCGSGYTGVLCGTEIDECESNPCQNGATCQDQVDSYSCSCAAGYTGTDCQVDIDECSPHPCNNGTCFDEVNGYRCECFPGFQGSDCSEDVDECSSTPCVNAAVCTNDINLYTCTCSPGYTGVNCEIDIDVCNDASSAVPRCQNGATCIDGEGAAFTCQCAPGFTGSLCEVDVDECESGPCENGATCADLIAGFNCTCAEGWTGQRCEEDVDECLSAPCLNGALCRQRAPGEGFACFCAQGFQGIVCEVDYDECLSDPCLNGAQCVDLVDGFACTCPDGFSGELCESDVEECASDPCQNNATCLEPTPGAYLCSCTAGFFGTNCEHVDYCYSQPCANGAFCITGTSGFQCFCPSGFTGPTCETRLVTNSSVQAVTSVAPSATMSSTTRSDSLPLSTLIPTTPSLVSSSLLMTNTNPSLLTPAMTSLTFPISTSRIETGMISSIPSSQLPSLFTSYILSERSDFSPVFPTPSILVSSSGEGTSQSAIYSSFGESGLSSSPSSSTVMEQSFATYSVSNTPVFTVEQTSSPILAISSSFIQSGVSSSFLSPSFTSSQSDMLSHPVFPSSTYFSPSTVQISAVSNTHFPSTSFQSGALSPSFLSLSSSSHFSSVLESSAILRSPSVGSTPVLSSFEHDVSSSSEIGIISQTLSPSPFESNTILTSPSMGSTPVLSSFESSVSSSSETGVMSQTLTPSPLLSTPTYSASLEESASSSLSVSLSGVGSLLRTVSTSVQSHAPFDTRTSSPSHSMTTPTMGISDFETIPTASRTLVTGMSTAETSVGIFPSPSGGFTPNSAHSLTVYESGSQATPSLHTAPLPTTASLSSAVGLSPSGETFTVQSSGTEASPTHLLVTSLSGQHMRSSISSAPVQSDNSFFSPTTSFTLMPNSLSGTLSSTAFTFTSVMSEPQATPSLRTTPSLLTAPLDSSLPVSNVMTILPTVPTIAVQSSGILSSPSHYTLRMSSSVYEATPSLPSTSSIPALQTTPPLSASSQPLPSSTIDVFSPSNILPTPSSPTLSMGGMTSPAISNGPFFTSSPTTNSVSSFLRSSEQLLTSSSASIPPMFGTSDLSTLTTMMSSVTSTTPVTTTQIPTVGGTTTLPIPTTTVDASTTPAPPITCEASPCQNGGVCRNRTTAEEVEQFACDCPFKFTGSLCETERALHFPSFNGSSYLEHAPLDWSTTSENSLFITIKTSATEGTVLFAANQQAAEFIHLFISDGRLVYEMSCGLGQTLRVESSVSVATDELVEVFLSQTRPDLTSMTCGATLSINNQFYSGQLFSFIFPAALGPLYIGGVPMATAADELTASSIVGYRGCVRHLEINDQDVLVFDDAVDGKDVEECVAAQPCQYQPCRNGGTCSESADGLSWSCDCPEMYQGALCERLVDHCQGSPCQAGGSCVSLAADRSFLCLCPYGRQGVVCEEEIAITRPSFGGTVAGYMSFVRYARVLNWDFLLTLRLKFTLDADPSATRSNLMLFSGQRGEGSDGDDYLAVGIQDGYVWFHFDVGSGEGVLRTPQPIDLGLPFHTLQIGRHRRDGWMKLDSQVNISAVTQGALIGLNTYRDLYVGGHDTTEIHFLPDVVDYDDSFKGCIYDLEINSGLYGSFVAPGNPPGRVDAGLNVGQCGHSECTLNECQNGAECVNLGASYICNCTDGWKGALCADVVTVCDAEHPDPHACPEGSVCTPLPVGYQCHCPLGRTGALCDEDIVISDPLFDGTLSYMSFARTTNLRFETSVLIEFRPLSDSGLLFYVASPLGPHAGDFFAVSLTQGFVELRYSLDGLGDPAILRTTGRVDVSSNTWYTVEVSRVNQNAILQFGSEQLFRRTAGNLVSLDVGTDLFVGGTPRLDDVHPLAVDGGVVMSFHGCVRRAVVNGRELELTVDGAVEGLGIADCDGTGCGYSVCKNGGTCSPVEGSSQDFTCQCLNPYTGTRCEDSVYCVDHRCENGALCLPDEDAANYSCGCPLGFQGVFCEEAVNITSAQFSGSSFLYIQDMTYDSSNKTETSVSFNFSTSASQGLLLWIGQPISAGVTDYLAVGLENGRLKISINLGHDSHGDVQHLLVVSDGLWHAVTIVRVGTDVRLYVDDQPPRESDIGGTFTDLDTDGHYYLGGFGLSTDVAAATGALYEAGFVGCIRDLVLAPATPRVDFMRADDALNVQSCGR
ncbi:uncharacterized protein [Diadema antillarum]|uniref:uncharacterized protein n=1 Tax=Diadema antillarum TaxID=105358 RepID=UPI003A875C1B